MGMSIGHHLHTVTGINHLQNNSAELHSTTVPDPVLQSNPQSVSTSSTSTSSTASRESVEAWLEHTAAASSTSPSPQSTPHQALKRRRSSSPDFPDCQSDSSPRAENRKLQKLFADSMDPNQHGPQACSHSI